MHRAHYGEMCQRLEGEGFECSPYNPRIDEYAKANDGGWFLYFVARHEGEPVGFCGVYLTSDMHNGDLIAQEDTIYVTPRHRNGLGRKLVKHVLAELKERGVKRAYATAATDIRAGLLYRRLGFKPQAEVYQLTF